ncbi:MAG TPA: hypothetical protein VHG08_28825 [Longimicrobium sp.]|nr:hypothetical protein [Longimicrobium sp.]
MPKPRVCVETTIPNFYYETRTEPELVARRNWTREWWADAAQRYELLTSTTVFHELAKGKKTSSRPGKDGVASWDPFGAPGSTGP